ncbi:MAG: thiamine pyrophosphate-binding protein [Candidatus Bathyarchaeia archaeon]
MRGGDIIVKTLVDIGFKIIFGLPGVHSLDVYRALRNEKNIRHVLMKHEANAGIAADVYGRLTGEPGIVLTIAGPGATNCVTAVAQAYAAASPLIHISGDIPLHPHKESLHGVDIDDFLARVFTPVTKWATRVRHVDEIAPTLIKAYKVSTEGRRGPVHVSIPIDVMESETKTPLNVSKPSGLCKAGEIDDETINKILSAKRPVIYAGKNVSRYQCEEKLLELCELLRAPLIAHGRRDGDDVIVPYDHPLYAGFIGGISHPAALHALKTSDLILSIGIRLGSIEAAPLREAKPLGCISIDVEGGDAQTNVNKIITGDIKETLTALINKLKSFPSRGDDANFLKEISYIKRQISEKIEHEIEMYRDRIPLHPGVIVKILNSTLGKDSILVLDCGLSSFWVRDVYKSPCIRGMISPGGYGSMGFALPAAIAAKIVYPKKKVFAVVGDGALLMSYSDLPTLIENNLSVVIVVFNDSKYGQVWQLQKRLFKNQFIATDLQEIDFAKIFSAIGGRGISARTIDEVKVSFEEAIRSEKPVLIDIKTDYCYNAPGANLFVQNLDLEVGRITD